MQDGFFTKVAGLGLRPFENFDLVLVLLRWILQNILGKLFK